MSSSSRTRNIATQLYNLIAHNLFLNKEEYEDFSKFIKSGKLTRGEDPKEHCCVFFIPINAVTKEILIVHHKKAKQWVVPGGHIEKGEFLEDAVKREAKEELGMNIERLDKPFLFSIMYIHNEGKSCKAHYDSWYLIPTTEKLNIDFTEFNDVRWVHIQKAKELISHNTYLLALERIENIRISYLSASINQSNR